jgi:hypothetical protein
MDRRVPRPASGKAGLAALSLGAGLCFLLSLLASGPALGSYVFFGLGPLQGVATQPIGINDQGQVAGTMTGT